MPSDGAILARLIKNMKRQGSDPLRPLLDEYLLKRDRMPVRHVVEAIDMAPPVRPPGRISPSGLGGCERQAVFIFVGAKGRKRIDPDQQLVFDDGTWRHHKWEATFQDMERVLGRDRFRVLAVEQRVEFPDLYVAGSLDVTVAIRLPNGRWRKYVIDIKGINDVGFGFVLRNDAPIAHHVQQLVAYEKAVGIPRGLLWYENKNNQLTKAFVVREHDALWESVESWCTSVVSHLRRKRLPPMHPECQRGTFTFERCPFTALCYGKRTTAQLTRYTFKNFADIDTAWQAGNEHAKESTDARSVS